jgi:Fe-S-cluster containining protein
MRESEEARFEPLKDRRFRFRCGPGVPCFTECCADLNLVLTPYDILRLKNRLGLDYEEFLARHTESVDEREGEHAYPRLRLRMTEGGRKACPFVSEAGCRIYEDRPSACRIYPLGRATARGAGPDHVLERFFVVREKHCRGFEETKEWTVDAWTADQGLEPYHRFNDQWMDIVTREIKQGSGENESRKQQMFYMASYNLDAFRRFVFESSFLRTFQMEPEEAEVLKNSEEALLEFAFRWLRFALFGEPTLEVRPEILERRRQETH